MNWAKVIWWIVSNIPTIYKVVKEIIDLINQQPIPELAKKELKNAQKKTREVRHFGPLKDLHSNLARDRMR